MPDHEMPIQRAYTAQLFPLRWENEFGKCTVIGINYAHFYGYELDLAQPLAGHEPETYSATVGDGVVLYYTPRPQDTKASLDHELDLLSTDDPEFHRKLCSIAERQEAIYGPERMARQANVGVLIADRPVPLTTASRQKAKDTRKASPVGDPVRAVVEQMQQQLKLVEKATVALDQLTPEGQRSSAKDILGWLHELHGMYMIGVAFAGNRFPFSGWQADAEEIETRVWAILGV